MTAIGIRIFFGGSLARPMKKSTGLPQGDILATLLYISYTSDISSHLPFNVKMMQQEYDMYTNSSWEEAQEATERAASLLADVKKEKRDCLVTLKVPMDCLS